MNAWCGRDTQKSISTCERLDRIMVCILVCTSCLLPLGLTFSHYSNHFRNGWPNTNMQNLDRAGGVVVLQPRTPHHCPIQRAFWPTAQSGRHVYHKPPRFHCHWKGPVVCVAGGLGFALLATPPREPGSEHQQQCPMDSLWSSKNCPSHSLLQRGRLQPLLQGAMDVISVVQRRAAPSVCTESGSRFPEHPLHMGAQTTCTIDGPQHLPRDIPQKP